MGITMLHQSRPEAGCTSRPSRVKLLCSRQAETSLRFSTSRSSGNAFRLPQRLRAEIFICAHIPIFMRSALNWRCSASACGDRPSALRGILIKFTIGLFLGGVSISGQGQVIPRDKKLIEYGWDVPTPAQIQEQSAEMEKRPFDGLIFRLSAGHNAFSTNRFEAAKFEADHRILSTLNLKRFQNNFVLVWGSPPPGFDWFDDSQWDAINANARLLVEIARVGTPRGICFDPEPYDFALW